MSAFLFLSLATAKVLAVPLNDFNYPHHDGKIVGGEPVHIEDFPYQIALQYNQAPICGGSIVGKNVIITAAHCVENEPPSHFSIRAGSSKRNSSGQVINVKSIKSHPSFSKVDYDIAVLALEKDLTLNECVKPVALPEENEEVPEGSDALVSGWGKTSPRVSAEQLRAVKVNVVNRKACEEAYRSMGAEITDRMICAGVPEGGKDACQGDSGGPLVINGKLMGVVSWGAGCARPKYPGVYASVPRLRKFVQEAGGV